MEFLQLDTHFAGCMLCQSVKGPFVACSAANYTVQTVEGPIPVENPIVLCAPTEGREGCAGQMARATGYMPPDVVAQMQEQQRMLLERQEELEGELAKAKSNRVVPVEDLLKLIGEEEREGAAAA